MHFVKAHATGNDFVIVDDEYAAISCTPDFVKRICDRHFGIGADGLIRVARTRALCEKKIITSSRQIDSDQWFMDYYNADGHPAEMCGNGVRAFAAYLQTYKHISADQFTVGTRGGDKQVQCNIRGKEKLYTIAMGAALYFGESTAKVMTKNGKIREIPGLCWNLGNPHLVCHLSDASDIDDLDLTRGPQYDQKIFPEGTNIEFFSFLPSAVNFASTIQTRMRVYERGSGETLSCGTGAVAVAASALTLEHTHKREELSTSTQQPEFLDKSQVQVFIPGGTVLIRFQQNSAFLEGSACLVAQGEIFSPNKAV